jgi:hypothetical protein
MRVDITETLPRIIWNTRDYAGAEGRFNETQDDRRRAAERPAQIQNAPVTLLLTGGVTWGARQFLILSLVPPASR